MVRHVLRHPEAAAVELRAAVPAALVERLGWPTLEVQGPDGWTAPRRLSELIAVPPELATTLDPPVELVYAIDDLHRVIERDPLAREEIVSYVEATRTLLFFAVRPDPANPDPSTAHRLATLGSRISKVHLRLGHEAAQTLLFYLTNAFRYRSRLHAILLEPIEEAARTMHTNFQEELRAGAIAAMQEQIIDELREQEREQGREQGMLAFLTGLLEARGLLDDTTRERLHEQRHDPARLQRWFQRALVATSTAEVFDTP